MPKDYEAVQQLKSNGRHDEEIDGRDIMDVVLKECTPGLGRRFAMPEHVLRHGRLVHRVAEQRQLRLNPRRSPRGVLPRHAPDQATDLCVDLWTPGLAARLPTPVEPEAVAVPANHGVWLDDQHARTPVRPEPVQPDPENPITLPKSRAFHRPLR